MKIKGMMLLSFLSIGSGWLIHAVPKAQADVSMVSVDFSAVRVFPNPWRADRHGGTQVRFEGLPTGSAVKLFTISGHKVKSLTVSGTSAPWDLTNSKGQQVASGSYLYVITAGGQKSKGQILVIK